MKYQTFKILRIFYGKILIHVLQLQYFFSRSDRHQFVLSFSTFQKKELYEKVMIVGTYMKNEVGNIEYNFFKLHVVCL